MGFSIEGFLSGFSNQLASHKEQKFLRQLEAQEKEEQLRLRREEEDRALRRQVGISLAQGGDIEAVDQLLKLGLPRDIAEALAARSQGVREEEASEEAEERFEGMISAGKDAVGTATFPTIIEKAQELVTDPEQAASISALIGKHQNVLIEEQQKLVSAVEKDASTLGHLNANEALQTLQDKYGEDVVQSLPLSYKAARTERIVDQQEAFLRDQREDAKDRLERARSRISNFEGLEKVILEEGITNPSHIAELETRAAAANLVSDRELVSLASSGRDKVAMAFEDPQNEELAQQGYIAPAGDDQPGSPIVHHVTEQVDTEDQKQKALARWELWINQPNRVKNLIENFGVMPWEDTKANGELRGVIWENMEKVRKYGGGRGPRSDAEEAVAKLQVIEGAYRENPMNFAVQYGIHPSELSAYFDSLHDEVFGIEAMLELAEENRSPSILEKSFGPVIKGLKESFSFGSEEEN